MELVQLDIVYVSFAIFLAATAYQYLKPKEPRLYTSVKVVEVYNMIKEGKDVHIIDVRNRDEYRKGHLRGAINVPMKDLDKSLNKIPMNKDVMVYCQTGGSSVRAVRRLEVAGYTNLLHMHEGYRGWKKAGHPTAGR